MWWGKGRRKETTRKEGHLGEQCIPETQELDNHFKQQETFVQNQLNDSNNTLGRYQRKFDNQEHLNSLQNCQRDNANHCTLNRSKNCEHDPQLLHTDNKGNLDSIEVEDEEDDHGPSDMDCDVTDDENDQRVKVFERLGNTLRHSFNSAVG